MLSLRLRDACPPSNFTMLPQLSKEDDGRSTGWVPPLQIPPLECVYWGKITSDGQEEAIRCCELRQPALLNTSLPTRPSHVSSAYLQAAAHDGVKKKALKALKALKAQEQQDNQPLRPLAHPQRDTERTAPPLIPDAYDITKGHQPGPP